MTISSLPAPSTILFALHILLLHPHIYLAVEYRTYRFLFLIGTGLVLEVTGQIYHTLHQQQPFTACATVFFCAAMHSLWVEVLGLCSETWETYERFLIAELVATCVVGGGAVAAWTGQGDMGEAILKAGLVWFASSVVVLMGAVWFYSFLGKVEQDGNKEKLEKCLVGLVSATICVLVRTCLRLTDWGGYFRRGAMPSEAKSKTLESGIMLLAVFILAICHPGKLLQPGAWMAMHQLEGCQNEKDKEIL
ncbi:hypothetical protein DE146DRAFT_635988 [Phaeosphaeria sp. MPI-PUGE-AT-0046c]|nr:hypothetical protein DE146DRAFT_635988 [Phaeosphaeria sp. MPI-PUGE-AT-0046c]